MLRPRACIHEIVVNPKITGMSQFQSNIMGKLASNATTTINSKAEVPISMYFILTTYSKTKTSQELFSLSIVHKTLNAVCILI